MRNRLFLLSFILIAFGSLWGQVTTGTISGRVADGTGSVIPETTLLIKNVETGIGRSVASDEKGHYVAANLALGLYEITVNKTGFQSQVRRGITLNVGQNAVIDFTLQVGTVSERVEVTADAPLIETSNANVAGLINEQQVRDLPLNARNLIELAPLYAGVAFAQSGERSASKGMATKLTISGTRYNASLFQLDGININGSAGSAGSAAGILMGAETIREFNVITNGYSAEYGRHTGGIFNAVTKSGTNSIHGSLFEFLRNDDLDARNFFDRDLLHPLVRSSPPPYKRNQFGGTVGGPLIRDRSFLFGSYEGLRERLGRTTIFNVPGSGLRQGQVPNPTNGQITTVVVAPAVKPYLDSFPSPNGQNFADGTGEYTASRSLPTSENFITVRGDHKISDKDFLFIRYTRDKAANTPNGGLMTYTLNESLVHYSALGLTRIISPTLINQFLAGFNLTSDAQVNTKVAGVPFPVDNFTGRKDGSIGVINIPGLSAWGGSAIFPRDYLVNTFQYKDDLTYTVGLHSLKFGLDAQRLQFNLFEWSNPGGTFGFNSLSGFLTGSVNTFDAQSAASEGMTYIRQTIYGLYAQDDYRLSPRLTLNLGLRYEFTTTPFEKYGRVGNLLDFYTPGQTTDKIILGNPNFLNPSLKNYAPRVGLAWNVRGDGKTSVRVGAGLFYDQLNAGAFLFGMHGSPPFFVVGTIRQQGLANFPDAFYTQQQILLGQNLLEGMQYHADQPTVYKYSADIQHEVLPNTSIEAGYSGTRGVHLMRILLMNPRVAESREGRLFIPAAAPFRHPALGRVRPRLLDDASSYHALRLSLVRRFSSHMQFRASYTWSKTIDDGSNWTGGTDFQNSPGSSRYLDLKERGLAAFDIRHNFVSNFSYDIPAPQAGGSVGKLLSGWQVSSIASLQGGNPDNVSAGVPPTFIQSGFIGDYPDLVGKVRYDTRNTDHYFQASAFQLPPGYSNSAALGGAYVGNAGRSTISQPGVAKVDFVLTKNTAITEQLQLQFRTEFFNLFNRANFGAPNGRVFATAAGAVNPTLGRITTAASGRQLQFGMRLIF